MPETYITTGEVAERKTKKLSLRDCQPLPRLPCLAHLPDSHRSAKYAKFRGGVREVNRARVLVTVTRLQYL